jgi:putative FmdB family regulatory protein
MPIYEYQCRRCHHNFEQIILSTREKVSCPECDSRAVEKQLSVFSSPGSHSEESAAPGGCASCTPQRCGCH